MTRDEERKRRAIESVMTQRHIVSSDAREALGEAYDVTHEYFAPFIVEIADRMLDDMRADVATDARHRVAFVGRDGHSLAVAVRSLDGQFFRDHCVDIVLSRVAVEAAVQDYERCAGRTFDEISDFRATAGRVHPDAIPNAFVNLDDYLREHDVPVGVPGSRVTLVDTSYKGTVQELLAAMYPETTFTGRYMSFGAAPNDPHPGSKFGYAVHLDSPDAAQNMLHSQVPEDVHLTFAFYNSIAAIEDFLHGARTSPTSVDKIGTDQRPARSDPVFTPRLDPLRVDHLYMSPSVREGVTSIALTAVRDCARAVATERERGVDPRQRMVEASKRFRDEIHRWSRDRKPNDPRLGRVLDSFVQRLDDGDKAQLTQAVSEVLAAGRRKRVGRRSLDTPDLFDYPQH